MVENERIQPAGNCSWFCKLRAEATNKTEKNPREYEPWEDANLPSTYKTWPSYLAPPRTSLNSGARPSRTILVVPTQEQQGGGGSVRTGNACTPFCCKPEIVVSSTCRIAQEARGRRWVVLSAYWSGSRGTRHPTQLALSLNARDCELRARNTLGLKRWCCQTLFCSSLFVSVSSWNRKFVRLGSPYAKVSRKRCWCQKALCSIPCSVQSVLSEYNGTVSVTGKY